MEATTAPSSVRTPGDVDTTGDREWLLTRPEETSDVSIDETDDGQTEITVPISSTTPHRSGSRMSESALEAMASQLREGTVGLWDDHGLDDYGWPEYRREDMYGWWVAGEVEDGVLYGTARLREGDERSDDLVDQLLLCGTGLHSLPGLEVGPGGHVLVETLPGDVSDVVPVVDGPRALLAERVERVELGVVVHKRLREDRVRLHPPSRLQLADSVEHRPDPTLEVLQRAGLKVHIGTRHSKPVKATAR